MFRPKLAYEPLSVLDYKVIASARSVPRGVEVGQMREYRQERRKVCAEGRCRSKWGVGSSSFFKAVVGHPFSRKAEGQNLKCFHGSGKLKTSKNNNLAYKEIARTFVLHSNKFLRHVFIMAFIIENL